MKATRCSSLLAVLLLAGCATVRPVPIREVAPEIPVPTAPALPAIKVPAKAPDGTFCFTYEQLLEIRDGIKGLEADDALLRELIARYNAWRNAK